MMHDNLKIVVMMHVHTKSNTSSVYSYHGPLTLFDDQKRFNTTFRNSMEFYKASINTNGGTMFEQDITNVIVAEMLEKILFKVFLYKFKQQYVGKNIPALRTFILAHTTRAITSIKASFIHLVTGVKITISPDDIFKQMTDYVVLLPNDASKWLFSLDETYFNDLTPAMQTDMNQNISSCRSKRGATIKLLRSKL